MCGNLETPPPHPMSPFLTPGIRLHPSLMGETVPVGSEAVAPRGRHASTHYAVGRCPHTSLFYFYTLLCLQVYFMICCRCSKSSMNVTPTSLCCLSRVETSRRLHVYDFALMKGTFLYGPFIIKLCVCVRVRVCVSFLPTMTK